MIDRERGDRESGKERNVEERLREVPVRREPAQNKDLAALREDPRGSAETGVPLGVPGAGVGLDVGLLDASSGAEMTLGLAHGGSSKEESVRAYYNYILDFERQQRETTRARRGVPVGAFMISSSIVRQDPPALVIRARAPSVKRSAATSSLGRSKILMSSVTVPTTTTVRVVLLPRCFTSLLRDTGGLIVLEATSLLRMVLQKLESVLLERNLNSCGRKHNGVSRLLVSAMGGRTYFDE